MIQLRQSRCITPAQPALGTALLSRRRMITDGHLAVGVEVDEVTRRIQAKVKVQVKR